MKNLTEEMSITKGIALTTDELEKVIKELFGTHIIFEFNLEGMFVGTENSDGETEEISQNEIFAKLAEYFDVKSVYAVFFDDVDTNLAYILYSVSEPQNVSPLALKKCIFISFNEFNTLIKKLLGNFYEVTYDMDGGLDVELDFNAPEDAEEPNHDKVLNALSEHYGVRVTSYHADDCDHLGVWICYR